MIQIDPELDWIPLKRKRYRQFLFMISPSDPQHAKTSLSDDSDIENNNQVNSPRNSKVDVTLESVSSLRDAHSGTMTEIKVWSHLHSPPRREDAVSPPVEPVSSQSSTSEDSPPLRPKYTLPPAMSRDKRTTTSSMGTRELLVETVSSLRDVASASLSDIKEWAAVHTRSDPIETIESSVSSQSSSSMLESKPKPREASPSRTKEANAALLESVSSLREAASETMVGIKEWAAKLPKARETSVRKAAHETKQLYSKQHGEDTASPERATRTLYGAQTGYETMEPFDNNYNEDKQRVNQKKNQRVPCSPQLKMMQDLVSPFLVCTSGGAANNVVASPTSSEHKNAFADNDKVDQHVPLTDRKGRPVTKESASSMWANWNPIIGALDNHRADSFDESILTYDSEAEEQEQIRRMTSWGTLGTMGTQTTALTLETARTLETSDGTMVEASMIQQQQLVQDDEGNLIHPVLLEKAKRRREERKKKKRTKLVKFDYPPISSLRECPRTDPEDLPNLFFTEEELDQIEDDRYETRIADDVEIVAISKSKDESLSDGRETDNVLATASKSSDSLSKPSPSGASFSKYTSTPKLRNGSIKQRRPHSPFPRRRSGSSEASPNFDREKKNASPPPRPEDTPSVTPSPPRISRSNSNREQRLIKGVQIFLRERSTDGK